MYNDLVEIRPHFFSLQELNGSFILNVKIPLNWALESEFLKNKEIIFLEQDKNDKIKLISFSAPNNQAGLEKIFNCVKDIIKVNIEREKKEILLQQKINELKNIFKTESLGYLANLKFDKENEQ